MGPDAMIFVFWMLSFKTAFSLFSFTFIESLFSSSSLSAIRVVSPAYLRLLIFLPAILIPACASSSPAFLMMYYSTYKLNKQDDNIQPSCTPFPIWNQFIPCPVLTCFLTCIQISQETGQVVWYSHLFQNFPQFVCVDKSNLFPLKKKIYWKVYLVHNTVVLFRMQLNWVSFLHFCLSDCLNRNNWVSKALDGSISSPLPIIFSSDEFWDLLRNKDK